MKKFIGVLVLLTVLLLAGMACLGSFAAIGDERFYLRQLPEFGDGLAQVKKIGIELQSDSHIKLYIEFIKEHLKLARKYFPTRKERISMQLAALHCILTRYSWMPSTIKNCYLQQAASQSIKAKLTKSAQAI